MGEAAVSTPGCSTYEKAAPHTHVVPMSLLPRHDVPLGFLRCEAMAVFRQIRTKKPQGKPKYT